MNEKKQNKTHTDNMVCVCGAERVNEWVSGWMNEQWIAKENINFDVQRCCFAAAHTHI